MITGFSFCNVRKYHLDVEPTAFANGFVAGFFHTPDVPSELWGEAIVDYEHGYREGASLRARRDMEGLLPGYIVGLSWDGVSSQGAVYHVRDLWS